MMIISRNKLSFVAAITTIWAARPVLVRARPPLMVGLSRLPLLLVMLGIALANLEAQVNGSGTPGRIPQWADATTLVDSTLSQDATGALSVSVDSENPAIAGTNTMGDAVEGTSINGHGVLGQSDSGRGVEGQSNSLGGVAGISMNGDGIGGITNGGDNAAAVFGAGQNAGNFLGNLLVTGLKLFRIDHPLDPANKHLSHSVIESPDVLNLYNGNVNTGLSAMPRSNCPTTSAPLTATSATS